MNNQVLEPVEMDIGKARAALTYLQGMWSEEVTRSDANRAVRYMALDTVRARADGTVSPDAFFIPVRVIDKNIRAEMPAFMSFITQSQKLIILRDQQDPVFKAEAVEDAFAQGMRYEGWERDWFKLGDSAFLHGWDAMEVVFDENRPLSVGLEHIGHDRLFFGKDTQDIQHAPHLVRVYLMTKVQLESMVKDFGFNKAAVDSVIGVTPALNDDTTYKIYKLFYKSEGKVFEAWLSDKGQDFLIAPRPFFIGIRTSRTVVDKRTGQPVVEWVDVQETKYPIFLYLSSQTEDPRIMMAKGRAFMDLPRQEAQTAIASGFVTRLHRSAGVYACPRNPTGAAESQTEIKLVPDRIMAQPFDFFTVPPPDSQGILSSLAYFDEQSAGETRQFTDVLREKKERVTAYAYQAAQQDAALLNSVPITLLSAMVRAVYSYAWRIVASTAQQGLISFCLIEKKDDYFVNDNELLSRNFDIRAAGDVEVVQRAAKIDRMMQMWPIMANTPAAARFLVDILKLLFPEQALTYAKDLMQAQQQAAAGQQQQVQAGKMLVAALYKTIQTILQEHPDAAKLDPNEANQWQQLQQMIQQFLSVPPTTQPQQKQ